MCITKVNKMYSFISHNMRNIIRQTYTFMIYYVYILQKVKMNLSPIEKALRLVGKTQMAKELGLTRAAVYSWTRKNKIPARHVLKIEQLSGISRYDLAPEIYGVAQS